VEREELVGVKSYKDLIVWQKAIDLVVAVYRQSKTFPNDETYGLRQQIRRAVVSIPSNIAEGQCRSSTGDFLRFLAIAYGSLGELETQVLIARRLEYFNHEQAEELFHQINEVGRLINGLKKSLATDH
jgi:four helix bundle protein